MNYFRIISILFFVIVKMKKSNCMDISKDSHIINKRSILNVSKHLWKIPIKYQIRSELKNSAVKEAIKDIENNTCIKFEETNFTRSDVQGLIFQLSDVCSSLIGAAYINKLHTIQLTKECSQNKGNVLHEIGHTLGLVHEHTRGDRDNYININWNNIETNKHSNFQLRNDSFFVNYSTNYDYGSIMHYDPYGFAYFFWKKVIKSKLHNEYERMMGQRENMVFNDYKKINLAYCNKCNFTKEKLVKTKKAKNNEKKNKNTTYCRNGGYPHYNNCSQCICPFGYIGPICRNIVQSDKSCGNTTFNVTKNVHYHGINGNKQCYIFLSTSKRKRINVGIYYSYSRSKEICTEDVSHQVKFLRDKGTTGLLLCSWRRDIINVTSESDSVLVYYNGQDENHFMQFGFRQVD